MWDCGAKGTTDTSRGIHCTWYIYSILRERMLIVWQTACLCIRDTWYRIPDQALVSAYGIDFRLIEGQGSMCRRTRMSELGVSQENWRLLPFTYIYNVHTSIKIENGGFDEIEDFVETHRCKLCVIHRSRVHVFFFLGLVPGASPYTRKTPHEAAEFKELFIHVTWMWYQRVHTRTVSIGTGDDNRSQPLSDPRASSRWLFFRMC